MTHACLLQCRKFSLSMAILHPFSALVRPNSGFNHNLPVTQPYDKNHSGHAGQVLCRQPL